MIHFNDLYISGDGNTLVIDVGIDTDSVYEKCYIDKILVDSCENVVNDTVSNSAYTAYEPKEYLLGDVNNDGALNVSDIDIINMYANQITSEIFDPSNLDDDTFKKLDADGNGEINIHDINTVLGYVGANEYVYAKEKLRHVRKCIPVADLPGKNKSLFIVRAEATYDDGQTASTLSQLDCDWDNSVIHGAAYDKQAVYDAAVRHAATYGNTCSNNDATAFADFILRYYSFLLALKCGDIKQACMYYNNYLLSNAVKGGTSSNGCGCHGTY